MKKLFPTLLLVAAILIGCESNSMQEVPETPGTDPDIPSSSVQTPTTDPTTEPTTVPTTEPPQPVYIYAGAMEDFLLPIEEFSWERKYAPEFVMIHFTSAVVKHRNDPCNITYIRQTFIDYDVSIHYIIERDGTIRCYIPEDRVAWHAGKGQWANDEKYTNNMNQYAIGIELVAIGSKSDMSIFISGSTYNKIDPQYIGFTDAQYTSLRALVEDICSRNQIPMDRDHVIGHEDYTSRKTDPGELFNWERLLG